MRYRYSALNLDGQVRQGLIEAENTGQAIQALKARGEIATRIVSHAGWGWRLRSDRVTRGELSQFLGDLAALYDAGAPIRKGLDVLAGEASAPRVAQLARMMAERLDAGAALGSAADLGDTQSLTFAAHLVRSGEASGALGPALRFASNLLKGQADATARIYKAMAYPAFLLALSLGAIVVLAVFAGPAITPLIEESTNPSGALLGLLFIGEVLQRYGFMLLALAAALTWVLAAASRRPPLKSILAMAWTRLPVVSGIVNDINAGAFARILGAMLAGGAPALPAFVLAAQAAPNAVWRRRFAQAANALSEGATIVQAIATTPAVPAEVVRLGRIGEESGTLGEMLGRAGSIVTDRALRRLDRIGVLLGPALVLMIGGFVGWLMSAFLGGLADLGGGAI